MRFDSTVLLDKDGPLSCVSCGIVDPLCVLGGEAPCGPVWPRDAALEVKSLQLVRALWYDVIFPGNIVIVVVVIVQLGALSLLLISKIVSMSQVVCIRQWKRLKCRL